jgi:hypothetical protein
VPGPIPPKKSSSGKSPGENQRGAYERLRPEVRRRRQALVNIKNQLYPINYPRITNTIIQSYRTDIDEMTRFFRSNKLNMDRLIKDTDGLCDKLDECMIKLNSALFSWDRSKSGGLNEIQTSAAEERYQNLLKDCRKLLDEALKFFY